MLLVSSVVIPTASHIEASRWIILAVCVVGVVLAYITDGEGYSLLVGDEGSSLPLVLRPMRIVTKCGGSSTSTSALKKVDSVSMALAAAKCALIDLVLRGKAKLASALATFWSRCRLYYSGFVMSRTATTKRHFFYLMEKKILNLPIRKGESEIDSYLDCKRHLGSRMAWPFMWEITNVKDAKVGCSGSECVPMSSYSYLDLVRDERVQAAAIRAAQEWSTGNHGPRMLGGNTKILCMLEERISRFFERDATLLCATGYLACMSACAAISSENTVIFADTRLHASLRAGLKIGDGKVVWFCHNNFADCEKKVKRYRKKYMDSWMVIESVYSMDGDIADLPKANAICQKYNIKLIVDEAHGLGVVGATGRGVEEHFGLPHSATLIVGTFSKSIASIGGYITGPEKLISYLDFHAPGNVFSAPLPAYCAGAALCGFDIIDNEPQLVKKAQQNARLLREKLVNATWPPEYPNEDKYRVEGDVSSTVLPVIFPDDIDRVVRIANSLKEKGYMCSAVAFPACPLRRPRFRITATSAYDERLISEFVRTFVETCVETPPSVFKLALR